MEPTLTVREACNILHVHKNTLRRWSNEGLINSYRIGPRGDRRFRPEDINVFLTGLNTNADNYKNN